MSPTVIVILRFVHIVCGVLWGGGVVVLGVFILPSVIAAGPAGGPVMKEMVQVRKMPNVLMGLAIATVLAGLGLFYNDAHGEGNTWASSRMGMIISIGALLALISVTIGATIGAPNAKKMGAHAAAMMAKGGPPSEADKAEMARLQQRVLLASRIVAVLVVLAATAMAVGRYL